MAVANVKVEQRHDGPRGRLASMPNFSESCTANARRLTVSACEPRGTQALKYAPDTHRARARTRLFKRSSPRRLRELSNAASRELNDCAAPCPADETANSGRRSRGWLLAPHLAWTLYLFRSVLIELGAGASARWPRSFSRMGGKRRLVKRTLWTSHGSAFAVTATPLRCVHQMQGRRGIPKVAGSRIPGTSRSFLWKNVPSSRSCWIYPPSPLTC